MSSTRRAAADSPADENPDWVSQAFGGASELGSPAKGVTTRTVVPERVSAAIAAPSDRAASSRWGETTAMSPGGHASTGSNEEAARPVTSVDPAERLRRARVGTVRTRREGRGGRGQGSGERRQE